MERGEVHVGSWINLSERDHLEGLGVDGSIILKRTKTNGSMDCIDLAQD
jgi:hypothetical protein